MYDLRGLQVIDKTHTNINQNGALRRYETAYAIQ